MAGSSGWMRRPAHRLLVIFHRTIPGMSTDNASVNAVCSHTGIQCLVALARHHGCNLNVGRLVHDHALDSEPNAGHLTAIAEGAGLRARSAILKWRELASLEDAFPVIAILRNGSAVIVREGRPYRHRCAARPAGPTSGSPQPEPGKVRSGMGRQYRPHQARALRRALGASLRPEVVHTGTAVPKGGRHRCRRGGLHAG